MQMLAMFIVPTLLSYIFVELLVKPGGCDRR